MSKLDTEMAEVLDGLNDLLQLDHDAVGSYEVAVEQLKNPEFVEQVGKFLRDHQRHIQELNDIILSLGGVPTNEPHATAPFKNAIQRIASAGGDEALLTAWRTNEKQLSAQYDAYAKKATQWPPEAKRVVDRNALDEGRHYAWVNRQLADVQVSPDVEVRSALPRPAVVAGVSTSEGPGARGRLSEGLHGAARQLHRFAEDRDSSEGPVARAAAGAEALSQTLDRAAERIALPGESVSVADALVDQIRSHPGRSLAATFAVAFLVGRMIR